MLFWSVMVGRVDAAEFVLSGGVFVERYPGRLQVYDQRPTGVVREVFTSVERVGDTVNLYCTMVSWTEPPVLQPDWGCGFDLGILERPESLTLNYFFRVRAFDDPPYSLRGSESIRVLASSELRTLVEFYHPVFNHYFITADLDEQLGLDGGIAKGWVRTGAQFQVFAPTIPDPRLKPVCRYYGRPAAGLDTHFFSSSLDECAFVAQQWPDKWILESTEAFSVVASGTTVVCPEGTNTTKRVFNGRFDVNHRYFYSHSFDGEPNLEGKTRNLGWISEGVAWCARSLSDARF